MPNLTFQKDQYGAPSFTVEDEAYGALGSMLTSDVQTVGIWLLRLLAWTAEVQSGTKKSESWTGNSWEVEITKKGLHLQDLHSDDWQATYPLAEAQQHLLTYWTFLTTNYLQKPQELAVWSQESPTPHPLIAQL